MYYYPVSHINISIGKIHKLWKDTYFAEHLARPRKNTISVDRQHLTVFNDEDWISSLGLKPVSAFFGFTPPNSTMSPHRDPSSNPEIIKQGYDYHPWALNIPLTCDIGSKIIWHRVKTGSQTRLDGAGHSPYNNVRVPMADIVDLMEVASVCLDRPMLISTFEWHSVVNNTNEPRLVFSLRFNPIMSLEEAAKLFESVYTS